MIDAHVHLRDGAQAAKETLVHGMRVGATCGIDAFFDMPNTPVPLLSQQAIEERLACGMAAAQQVEKIVGRPLFYGVYGGLTADPLQITAMVKLYGRLFPRMVGLKLFACHSTGNLGIVDPSEQRNIYRLLAKIGYTGVLAVHCEKESCMKIDLWDENNVASYCDVRPGEAEAASVADQMAFAEDAGFAGTLHVCHISTAKALSVVAEARLKGMRMTCGSTAHHALLNRSAACHMGNLVKMNPPLRAQSDCDALVSALADGSIDWIESDHAPHTLEDKEKGAAGIPGFAGLLLLVRHLRKRGVSEDRLAVLCGRRVNEVFGLDLPVTVPSDQLINAALEQARRAYPWDPFCTVCE